MGPFSIADLYDKLGAKGELDAIEEESKVDHKEVIAALGKTYYYVIDWKRPGKTGDDWQYHGASPERRPKIVLEGRLSFSFKGKNGDALRLTLRALICWESIQASIPAVAGSDYRSD